MDEGMKGELRIEAFGDNSEGQTTIPQELLTKKITAISAGGEHTVVLAEGKLYAFGWNIHGQTTIPQELLTKKITAISAGA